MFVATSVAIGIVPFTGNPHYNLVPVGLGLAGACFLFYGSVLLILEARLALSTIHAEMDFIGNNPKERRRRRSSNNTNHTSCISDVMNSDAHQIFCAFVSSFVGRRNARSSRRAVGEIIGELHSLPARLSEQSSEQRDRRVLFRSTADRFVLHAALRRRAAAGWDAKAPGTSSSATATCVVSIARTTRSRKRTKRSSRTK